MRAAITRHMVASVIIAGGLGVGVGCFRGSSLVDPSGPAGYRAPDPHVMVITLAPTAVSGAAGTHVQISAAPQGQSGQPVSASAVAWVSSNPAIATVSGSGMITLVRRGTATITAIADGVTASVGAAVDAPPPTSVTVTPSSTLIQSGQRAQLAATALDVSGAVDSGVAISWFSSNSGVASVSSSGEVTAGSVGNATITASSGGASGTATIQVTSSAPVVASVSVSPSSSSLYPGRTKQLTATLKDASGNILSGTPVSWTTSSSGVASVSSSGVVSGVAVGSATITAAAGGQSGTASVTVSAPVVASVSLSPSSATMAPGETTQLTATARDAGGTVLSVGVSWATTDPAVASVSSSGLVTANANGSATIKATAGGVSGAAAVTVESGPPGGFNEPAGMSTQINTGPVTSTSVFTVFSPSTPSSLGDWSGNLTTVPGGTGLRVTYPPTLPGGNSPARWGVGIPSAGTGWYYQRMKVRFSPNWTMNGNVDVKLCEPRTQQTGSGAGADENDVIAAHDFETQSTHAFLFLALQGPNGHFADLTEQPEFAAAANLAGDAWHTMEVLFAPESSPGAGNGTYTAWVDGTQIAHYTSVPWLASGNQVGWPYLMFDPTYGGGTHSPVATMYWDFDQLYVSTK
jgi:uncharacterized protein YjdB